MDLLWLGSLQVDDVRVKVLECVYQWLDLYWPSTSQVTERLDVHAQGGKDPDRLQYDIQETVELVVLVFNAKFTRKARSLSYVNELSDWLLLSWGVGPS